ncbi:ATP-grasp domain-containing protein [Allokutzneria sp. A3M-2-11 16]|uniref:acetyl/propionyl/methylcrotonyl-CoA carboxylase subunit alpha n=1 Tax=Allokutzneria sp. A3M-2-11 16 TaxID=2962043 RepID=UPI0020B8C424|nr:biotin carboxylase N-terminal domain-containing protein [Allokutzneria sp. A3M-2-11 16]MCP3801313.1 ATP-grasp domain-containing protein [Allokutzneria sp. A3M-2-11 16]
MISCLLIANRGEIARRVIATCRVLGIRTVAVFSDPDADAPHVREADVAVRLPGAAPTDTYLRGELLIRAARDAGADAVHPGYGFLSENAEFARAVLDAGLTWVGPAPEAIEAMGSKVAAKRLMAEAGVPVLPELVPAEVTEADLPVLVKASAGGGGRGMRIVRALAELDEAVRSARAEAGSAFGDDTVFCEPYLERGRHIEVQVLADRHGTVWALGERECSIQRRYQKVVEESPSPAVSTDLRAALCSAAVAAARAINYVGAGTVEFMVSPKGDFFFLETNTRLQVEHPVTECVTGVDLVRAQLEIAEGGRLAAEPPVPRGHAIEVRLYAEDPAAGWRPQSGPLHRFEMSTVDTEFAVGSSEHGLRLDSGVESGSVIGTHYDPMLAKVIAWAPTRIAAARRLASALAGARLHGPATNRDLLVDVLRHKAFVSGETDTSFLETHRVVERLGENRTERLSALAAAVAESSADRRTHPAIPPGWRNLPSQLQRKRFAGSSGEHEVAYRLERGRLLCDEDVVLFDSRENRATFDIAGVRRTFHVAAYGDRVFVDSSLGSVALQRMPRFTDPAESIAEGSLLAPMPGTVVELVAKAGGRVEAGAELVVLEAMKMRHSVRSPNAGIVEAIEVKVGDQVDAGAVLAVVGVLDVEEG